MRDTTPDAARVQADILRRLGPDRRSQIAAQLSDAVRELALERIRAKHPELDEDRVRDELVWELYGVRLPPR